MSPTELEAARVAYLDALVATDFDSPASVNRLRDAEAALAEAIEQAARELGWI